MRRTVSKSLLLLAIIALPFGAAYSQENAPSRWSNGVGHSTWDVNLDPDDHRKMLSLWDAIGEELKSGKHEVAGTYFKGGYSSGYFLRWSVSKGFVVIPYFDQNLITDYGYGVVTFVDSSRVIFTSQKELRGGRGLGKMPREWTAIFEYFVPVELLRDFGRYRAGLGQYNEFNGSCCNFVSDFLARLIDGPITPVSHPVPMRYRHFLKDPVTAHITAVGRGKWSRNLRLHGELYSQTLDESFLIPVSINVGRRHGVKRNMLFRITGEPKLERYLYVLTVEAQESHGYVVQFLPPTSPGSYSNEVKPGFRVDYITNALKPLPRIKVGTEVTTSPIEN